MSIRCIRLANLALLAALLFAIVVSPAAAQNGNYSKQRNTSGQQGFNAATRSRSSQNANQARQQGARVASKPQGATGGSSRRRGMQNRAVRPV